MLKVMKSSGILQEFDPAKLIKVLEWACVDTLVDPYELYRKIKPQLVDNMSTTDIQDSAIKVAADNITKDTTDYQYVASNLAMFGLRKKVYGQFEPIPLYDHISNLVDRGVYDKEVLEKWTKEEITELGNYVDHDRDFTLTYAGSMQLIEKYLVKNRSTNEIYETPQYAYILIAMTLHQDEPFETRMDFVKKMYDAVSLKKISLPTPIMAGVRTPTRQFSSCVVIESGDSLDSINASSAAVIKYISKRAGIGIQGGAIRAEGSPIGSGEVRHTGVVPFWKHFQSAVKSCVTPNTLVFIKGQGPTKIDDVVPGMEILTSSDPNQPNKFSVVLDKWDSNVKPENQLILTFENNTKIRCSTDHKIMYYDAETDSIKRVLPLELTPEHKIISANPNNRFTKLKSIERDDQDQRYIDITVQGTESFFAADEIVFDDASGAILISNCSQGGIRGGAATLHYPAWHLEFENLIVLKNNKGVDENRIRHLDYSVQLNKLMMDRLINDEYITLFSPDIANGKLYKYFFEDQDKFKELYEQLEKDQTVRKKRIKATEFFATILNERASTGRIYIMFVDNTNNQGPFDQTIDPIRLSNLCLSGDTKVDILVDGENDTRQVTMADLNAMINEMDISVKVHSYDNETGLDVYMPVSNSALMNSSAEVMKIQSGGSEIICTPYHKIWTKDRDWVMAKDLSEEDMLLMPGSGYTNIDSIDYLDTQIPVYDITVEETHCFYANNILVHNCQEITLPTSELGPSDLEGEIALCTLSAFVLDNFDATNQEEVNELALIMVRALDNLLDYQDYPVIQAEHTLHRRALGIGVTNYAAWLASNFHKYTNDRMTVKAVHELFERLQYGLIKASVQLAKEKGSTIYTQKTLYGNGQLPIDWYNKNVDKLVSPEYVCDWEQLRSDLIKYGIRNSTLSAFMPSETSSQVSNSTNGIEPPRQPVVTKQSKDGVFNQVVPNYETLGMVYDYAWDMAKRGNQGYLTHVAIMQKFVDQSISTNTYYDPQNYETNKVPLSVMMEDLLFCNYYGIKTLYYHNTRDGAEGSEEVDCDSCKL